MSTETNDLTCMACGFDLRAHASVDRCPECGVPVARSARHEADRPFRDAQRNTAVGYIVWTVLLILLNVMVPEASPLCACLWLVTLVACVYMLIRYTAENRDQTLAIIVVTCVLCVAALGLGVNVLLYWIFLGIGV